MINYDCYKDIKNNLKRRKKKGKWMQQLLKRFKIVKKKRLDLDLQIDTLVKNKKELLYSYSILWQKIFEGIILNGYKKPAYRYAYL